MKKVILSIFVAGMFLVSCGGGAAEDTTVATDTTEVEVVEPEVVEPEVVVDTMATDSMATEEAPATEEEQH